MLPSSLKSFKQMCAVMESFRNGRFYQSDYAHPSRADAYLSGSDLMDGWVARHLSGIARDLGIKAPRNVWPLVENVVRAKAVAFRERPTIRLVDAAGVRVAAEKYPIVRRLDRVLDDSGLMAALETNEQILGAHQTSAIWFRIVDGQFAVSALPPHAFDVEPWRGNRQDCARALSIAVPYEGDGYPSAGLASELRYFYQRPLSAGTPWRAGIVDPLGKPVASDKGAAVDMEEAPDGFLRVAGYPLVVWRERDTGGPYAPPALAMHNAQVHLNLSLVHAQIAQRMGSYGQVVASKQQPNAAGYWQQPGGMGGNLTNLDALSGSDGAATKAAPSEIIRVPGNVYDIIQLPEGWRADLLQPRVNVDAMIAWVEFLIKMAYLADDLVVSRADLTNPQPGNYSARAREVDAEPLEGARQRRERRLARFTVQTLRVWRDWWNLVCAPEDRVPEELDFRVQFGNLWTPDILSNQSAMQGLQEAAKMGLLDLVELRREIDDSTYDEAYSQFWSSCGTFTRSQNLNQPRTA